MPKESPPHPVSAGGRHALRDARAHPRWRHLHRRRLAQPYAGPRPLLRHPPLVPSRAGGAAGVREGRAGSHAPCPPHGVGHFPGRALCCLPALPRARGRPRAAVHPRASRQLERVGRAADRGAAPLPGAYAPALQGLPLRPPVSHRPGLGGWPKRPTPQDGLGPDAHAALRDAGALHDAEGGAGAGGDVVARVSAPGRHDDVHAGPPTAGTRALLRATPRGPGDGLVGFRSGGGPLPGPGRRAGVVERDGQHARRHQAAPGAVLGEQGPRGHLPAQPAVAASDAGGAAVARCVRHLPAAVGAGAAGPVPGAAGAQGPPGARAGQDQRHHLPQPDGPGHGRAQGVVASRGGGMQGRWATGGCARVRREPAELRWVGGRGVQRRAGRKQQLSPPEALLRQLPLLPHQRLPRHARGRGHRPGRDRLGAPGCREPGDRRVADPGVRAPPLGAWPAFLKSGAVQPRRPLVSGGQAGTAHGPQGRTRYRHPRKREAHGAAIQPKQADEGVACHRGALSFKAARGSVLFEQRAPFRLAARAGGPALGEQSRGSDIMSGRRDLEPHVRVAPSVDEVGRLQRHLVPPEQRIVHGLDPQHQRVVLVGHLVLPAAEAAPLPDAPGLEQRKSLGQHRVL